MATGAFQDDAPGAVSVYDTTPEQQHAATMYVCTRLDAGDARVVLEALGLIDPVEPYEQAARDSLGRLAR